MPLENNFAFNPEFKPMLQVGQTAKLIRGGNEQNALNVEVIGIFPLPGHRHSFGVLSAASLNQDCTHIRCDDGEMAQLRYIIRGRFRVALQNPSGVDLYTTNGSVKGDMTQGWFMDPGMDDPNELVEYRRAMWAASELFVFEAERPRWDLYPYAPAAQIEAYVDLSGWGFALKKADREPPVKIWINGRPRGTDLGT